jgi:hypothetical protein
MMEWWAKAGLGARLFEIQLVVDETLNDDAVFLIKGDIRFGDLPACPKLLGSTRGFGAMMAYNVAKAHLPEGIRW